MNKKRALCVGINYTGTSNELSGCVNDAVAWQSLLGSRGYEVTLLLDRAATRDNLLNSLRSFVDLTGYRDRFVFTYSGHGTWVPDQNGDEADGRDEAIVPADFLQAGVIRDDDLYDVWSRKRFGARLANLSDSCFSGTVQRFLGTSDVGRVRFLPPGAFLAGEALSAARAVESLPVKGTPRESAVLISGCSDTEFSYDETSQQPPMGAFTRRAIEQFHGESDTYQSWFARIRTVLPTDSLPQTPQLQGTWYQRHCKAL